MKRQGPVGLAAFLPKMPDFFRVDVSPKKMRLRGV
jgi:hypothetical protein